MNEFLDEYADSPMPEFNKHVKDSLGYYVAASTAWNARITKSYERIRSDPYTSMCNALTSHFNMNEIGVVVFIAFEGQPYLWQCAKDELSQAEAVFKK